MNQDITALRAHLFAALAAVRDGTLELDKARTVNDIAKTLIDSARVEVDYLRTTGIAAESAFLGAGIEVDPGASGAISSIVRHRLQG
jgi:hypothetical protein